MIITDKRPKKNIEKQKIVREEYESQFNIKKKKEILT